VFEVEKTSIEGVLIIKPKVYGDDRGFFMETWNKRDLKNAGLDVDFVQDNHSKSVKGVLRGIHFQTKHPQGKLVRVIKGEVFDVAVDLRKDSPTFGKYESIILSEENKLMFYIPPELGHGFLTLSDEAEVLYKATDYYYPEYDSGLIWNDKIININWPITKFGILKILLSKKDEKLLQLNEFSE
jgi:dTDP-4-dehydrorhamnose 3,5-epimerase